jgi:hypothetical protein
LRARRNARGLRAALVQVGSRALIIAEITAEISATINAVLDEFRGYSSPGPGGDRCS